MIVCYLWHGIQEKLYRESFLLYGTYPDESVYMLQNYLNNHFDKLNYQYISAASVCFTSILAGITIYGIHLHMAIPAGHQGRNVRPCWVMKRGHLRSVQIPRAAYFKIA